VKFWFLIAISALASIVSYAPLRADTVADELQARLVDLDGIVARFTQQITDAKGFVVEEATGTLHLAKPQFRWQVEAPFAQIIVAHGGQVEIYDPDLEQVTQRDIDGAIDQAPLALLTQEELALEEHFHVDGLALDSTHASDFNGSTVRAIRADIQPATVGYIGDI
jgi:chaperone LolA